MDKHVPDGFAPLFRSSPFLDMVGPLYGRPPGPGFAIGLRAEARHCNARGTVHGGMLATICDLALGYAMAFSAAPALSLATASLTLSYSGSAKAGDWIESRTSIQHVGSRLAYASCDLVVEGKAIVHAAGVYMNAGAL